MRKPYPDPKIELPSDDGTLNPLPTSVPEASSQGQNLPTGASSQAIVDLQTVDQAPASDLYKATIIGDWKRAKTLINYHPDIVRIPINGVRETALHVAIGMKHKNFVKKLIKKMNVEDLKLESQFGSNAMGLAAASGDLDIAKVLLELDNELTQIADSGGKTPIGIAASQSQRKMVLYLYKKTKFDSMSSDSRITEIFHSLISADFYDLAMDMIDKYKHIGTSKGSNQQTALKLMAQKRHAMVAPEKLQTISRLNRLVLLSTFSMVAWQIIQLITTHFMGYKTTIFEVISGIDYHQAIKAHQLVEKLVQLNLDEDQATRESLAVPLLEAAALGNVEFLIILIRSNPDILLTVDGKNRSLFHIAAMNRWESIFSLIYEIGGVKDAIVSKIETDSDNNLLHLVASEPPTDPAALGPALQMQMELLWFKSVEKIVPPSYVNIENSTGKLPKDMFKENHTNLQTEGETWIRNTASSCMLVATLIVTVVFAAAFTVPGGNNDSTGTPILQRQTWFSIFILSDSLAMVSASTSILTFLSILTSRYAEKDFLLWLPMKLMMGLSLLFISIITMMLSFAACILLIYGSKLTKFPIVIISLVSVATASLALLQGGLWIQTIRATYWSNRMFDARESRLFKSSTTSMYLIIRKIIGLLVNYTFIYIFPLYFFVLIIFFKEF